MVIKYIELDSTYRNRTSDPLPGSFTINISQTGLNNRYTAVDPVTDAYPILPFIMEDETQSVNIEGPSDNVYNSSVQTIIVSISAPLSSTNILNENYFKGAVLYTDPATASRILEWKYLYSNSKYYFQVTLDPNSTPAIITVNTTAYIGGPLSRIDIGNSSQYLYIPESDNIPNIYENYYVLNATQQNYTQVTSYNKDTHLMKCTNSNVSSWVDTDILVLRKSLPLNAPSGKYYFTIGVGPSSMYHAYSINDGANAFNVNQTYINSFINYFANGVSNPTQFVNIAKIIGVYVNIVTRTNTYQIPVLNGLELVGKEYNNEIIISTSPSNIVIVDKSIPIGYNAEIMIFSRDNYSPFTYTGSLSSQNESVAYEISLISLTLPNEILTDGGRIAYYPYVYIEVDFINASNLNSIYSNNPNTQKVTFKVPITDLNHPRTTPFIKLDSKMIQTLTCKPNTDICIKIKLPNGNIFTTVENDTSYGQTPNPMIQTSCLIGMKRI